MGEFIVFILLALGIVLWAKGKADKVNRKMEARNKPKQPTKTREQRKIEALEDRIDELEDLLIGRDDDYDDYD